HVRDRPAARERAGGSGKADELAHPADGLLLHLRRGAGPQRKVDVEAGREQVAEDADLETRRADEGEEPRPRLRERRVEDPGGVLERPDRARAFGGPPPRSTTRARAPLRATRRGGATGARRRCSPAASLEPLRVEQRAGGAQLARLVDDEDND